MKWFRTQAVVLSVALAIVAWLGLRFAPSCLLRVNLDPGALQPPYFVIMNPARDKVPERLADEYFRQLAAGRVARVKPFFGANREVMVDAEVTHPPISWKVENREDQNDRTVLYYRVERTGGSDVPAMFEFTDGPEWKLASYNAVY